MDVAAVARLGRSNTWMAGDTRALGTIAASDSSQLPFPPTMEMPEAETLPVEMKLPTVEQLAMEEPTNPPTAHSDSSTTGLGQRAQCILLDFKGSGLAALRTSWRRVTTTAGYSSPSQTSEQAFTRISTRVRICWFGAPSDRHICRITVYLFFAPFSLYFPFLFICTSILCN